MTSPHGKDERQRRNVSRALIRFSGLFYRHVRRQEVVLEAHQTRLDAMQDRLDDLADQVRQARDAAFAARALYYDTHDTTTGEHVGGGVFDEATATYVRPRPKEDDGAVDETGR